MTDDVLIRGKINMVKRAVYDLFPSLCIIFGAPLRGQKIKLGKYLSLVVVVAAGGDKVNFGAIIPSDIIVTPMAEQRNTKSTARTHRLLNLWNKRWTSNETSGNFQLEESLHRTVRSLISSRILHFQRKKRNCSADEYLEFYFPRIQEG